MQSCADVLTEGSAKYLRAVNCDCKVSGVSLGCGADGKDSCGLGEADVRGARQVHFRIGSPTDGMARREFGDQLSPCTTRKGDAHVSDGADAHAGGQSTVCRRT